MAFDGLGVPVHGELDIRGHLVEGSGADEPRGGPDGQDGEERCGGERARAVLDGEEFLGGAVLREIEMLARGALIVDYVEQAGKLVAHSD